MKKTNNLSKQAMIAALYTVIGFVMAPISFGAVQARISEALTLLPVFGIQNVWGITVGCFLTNLIGIHRNLSASSSRQIHGASHNAMAHPEMQTSVSLL